MYTSELKTTIQNLLDSKVNNVKSMDISLINLDYKALKQRISFEIPLTRTLSNSCFDNFVNLKQELELNNGSNNDFRGIPDDYKALEIASKLGLLHLVLFKESKIYY